jgi:hypothetical protein
MLKRIDFSAHTMGGVSALLELHLSRIARGEKPCEMNAKERKLLAKKQRKFHHTHTDAAGELESIFANAMNRIRSDLVREKIDPASKLGKEVTGIAMYEVDNFVAERVAGYALSSATIFARSATGNSHLSPCL